MAVPPKPYKPKGKTRVATFEDAPFLLGYEATQARTAGACERCSSRYRKDDWVFIDEDRLTVGVHCCGNAPVTMEEPDDIAGRELVPLSQVMPANRTKADMCRVCFQIPSANGICGC